MIAETRFREATGHRFLANGKIRCHALSKSQIRKWRAEFNDSETDSAELWPECQCTRPAVEGGFVCRWHGGNSLPAHKITSILDIMPIDLAEKFKVLAANPNYISRQEDLLLLRARIWELTERLNSVAGGTEAWGMVAEALVSIQKEEIFQAIELLKNALASVQTEEEVWNEIRKTESLIGKLTSTEVRTAKELRLMASVEQVTSLMLSIERLITYAAENYIDDDRKQREFIQYFADQLRQLTNVGAGTAIRQLESAGAATHTVAEPMD